MLELIKSNTAFMTIIRLLNQCQGVGKIMLAFIAQPIISTNLNLKALGSYCGVVPFGKESGR
ncbi:MAG: hypothetical protein IPO92_16855 [Saprospiraceae bacterium]|nr:hypothetical protein [Saprospiraceae bacterium]